VQARAGGVSLARQNGRQKPVQPRKEALDKQTDEVTTIMQGPPMHLS
jgi:hypothetical protein